MTSKALLPDGYHLSLSISQSLWADLLGEALPIQVGEGNFDLIETGRTLLDRAEDQIKGLLTGASEKMDEAPVLGNSAVKTARRGVLGLAVSGARFAKNRARDSLSVTGKWRARVSREGSRFSYHQDGVTLDATAVFEVEGRAILFGDQFEVPFAIGRSLSATASLDDVRFSSENAQLQGQIRKVSLSLGESLPLRLLKALGDRLIEQQIGRFNPLPLIPAAKLENMITPGDGPLKLSAGIDELHVGINENDLTLSVRFAFKGSGVAA
ncbi:MAG: hypothetical protein VX498_05615 [Myxococcota bacterium]|nr:hypothetical protein [Myxococcota bacterium]